MTVPTSNRNIEIVNRKNDLALVTKMILLGVALALTCQFTLFKPKATSSIIARVPSLIEVPLQATQNCKAAYSLAELRSHASKFVKRVPGVKLKVLLLDRGADNCSIKLNLVGNTKAEIEGAAEEFLAYLKTEYQSVFDTNIAELQLFEKKLVSLRAISSAKGTDYGKAIKPMDLLTLKAALSVVIAKLESPKYEIMASSFSAPAGLFVQTLKFIVVGILFGLFLFSFVRSVVYALK